MQTFREQCQQRHIPIISPATEDFLKNFLENQQPTTILELGSAVGYSTIFFASLLKKRNGTIYSFEISYLSYLEALDNIRKNKLSNIRIYPFNINNIDFKDFLPSQIDFIFIDAQKNQYGNYMMKICKYYKIRPIIIIDDVIKYHNKLSTLYEYLQKMQINYQILQLDPDDGIMIITPK